MTSFRRISIDRRAQQIILSLLIVGLVTAVMLPLRPHLDALDILLLYLAGVACISLLFDLRASLVASGAAFLTFNFFFTVPYYTFTVDETGDILALVAFLGLAILITNLVGRIRVRTMEAIRRGRQTETLYRLSVALIRESDAQSVQRAIVDRVRQVFDLKSSAILILDEQDQFRVGAYSGDKLDFLDRNVLSIARWSIERGEPASMATSRVRIRLPKTMQERHHKSRHEMLFIPVITTDAEPRVLLVARDRGRRPFDEEEMQLLTTFANQAAIAVERSVLVDEHTRAEILARTDELKTALLSAVSHDLRTPLASIKASVTTLMQPGITWSEDDRQELLKAVDEEADRLNRLVTSLLDLSRIEAGKLKPALDWYETAALVAEAIDRSEPLLDGRSVSVDLPEGDWLVEVDFVMITEVLVNLIENAAKYSPAGSPISIVARQCDGMMRIQVRDAGIGIPPGEEDRIFDKFYRVEAEHRPIGSGMGLAICRGFVEAHGGRIWARRNDGPGSTFTFTIPLASHPQDYSPEPSRADEEATS